MNQKRIFLVSAAVLALGTLSVKATLVATLDLDALSAESTLIVAAQVVSIEDVGKTAVQLPDRIVPAREMVVQLRVDQVLKGTAPESPLLKFSYSLPEEFIGWKSVGSRSYRIFFLAESQGGLRFSNPYYPSLAAVPSTRIQRGTPLEQVIAQLGAVVESGNAPLQDRREAVYALDSSKHPQSLRELRRFGQVENPNLRLSVTTALLEHNDISTLAFAEQALLKPGPSTSSEDLHNLRYAIHEGVKDERAVPVLAELLRAGDSETRRAAASALMHVGSSTAISPLLSAIDDSDAVVQYYSVVALAEITGQTDWRPNMEDFRVDGTKYLNHWRNWSQTR